MGGRERGGLAKELGVGEGSGGEEGPGKKRKGKEGWEGCWKGG